MSQHLRNVLNILLRYAIIDTHFAYFSKNFHIVIIFGIAMQIFQAEKAIS